MTPVVECEALASADQQVRLAAMGTVVPAHQVQLKAQVTGKILSADPSWIEGGRFARDALIMTLEASDYEIALQQAQADLAQAQSDLTLESGRQDVARREWQLLGQKGEKGDSELALRLPQLKAAEARVQAAEARVQAADLALSRTRIHSPFNGLVTLRQLNAGDVAMPQAALGSVVDRDEFHVRVSVPAGELKWIVFPSSGAPGSAARISLPGGGERKGEVQRLLPDLEPAGRMARVLVSVRDPMEGEHPLLLGSFVEVEITGTVITDACRIRREHYREGGQIWMMTPGNELRILTAKPLWSDRDHIVARVPLQPGEQLITSDLAAAIDGMELRVAGAAEAGEPTAGKAAKLEPKKRD
jgi:RND family efflux transporter MFP subunit